MINRDQLAEAARHADAIAEEHQDLERYWRERGVDIEGLTYVAEQRGLRAVMVLHGRSPNVTRPTTVSLSANDRRLQAMFAAIFMDGFAVRDRVTTEPTA